MGEIFLLFDNELDKNFRNTSPGLDNAHTIMLKNLQHNSVIYLLSLFNAIFPSLMVNCIILPFLKPNADPILPVLVLKIKRSAISRPIRDLPEAFPCTWRYYICNKLYSMSLPENFQKFCKLFLITEC